ncbi:MAG: hypothetical protein Q4C13_08310, partial [Clostridia bacterium]|nr:hypothetical protein [Clostridia bacterium]
MKLRIKLTVCAILLLVIAVALCCCMILAFVQNKEMQALTDTGLADYDRFYSAFQRAVPRELPD